MPPVQVSLLKSLEPISALSPGRVSELVAMCVVETVSQGLNPFRMNVVQSPQLMYLLKGDLKLVFADNRSVLLQGGSSAARHPVVNDATAVKEAIALTDIEILRIDSDLLDIMLTWDQFAGYEKGIHKMAMEERNTGDWMDKTGVFSAESLKSGIFSTLPPANVEEMFRRMERIPVTAGQVIIRQGDEGYYYYLIESGTAEVVRIYEPGASPEMVAVLDAGCAFGEEALVSGSERNATVTMKTDGALLRLGKRDFIELLKKPLLNTIDQDEARRRVEEGAILLDVRLPSEFDLDHMPGAVNTPLHQIRESMKTLSKGKEYITWCQSGRRASAAAFVLSQNGFRASVQHETV